MTQLDERQQAILHAVVIEYVNAAEPVGSQALLDKYGFGVKAATIRNELAEMSDLGFLEQPHTSAGRIPSDLGYRYYVDHLIVPQRLDEATRQKVSKSSEAGEALHAVLRDTSRALSRLTHLLTLASVFTDRGVEVRNVVVSALGPNKAMLMLLLSNGHVVNRMIECPPGLTLDDVGVANEQLAQAIGSKNLRDLARVKVPATNRPAVDKMLGTIWSHLKSIVREMTRGSLITAGEEFIISQPEFQRDMASLIDFLEATTASDALADALSTPSDTAQIVTIGREHRNELLHRFSVVKHSFYVGANEAGVIAIVGPTRMRYETSIPLVTYTARALTDSLTRFFA